MSSPETRLEHLGALRDDLRARMTACDSDQNFAVMGRLLTDVLKQIDEIGGEQVEAKETGLSDFEKRLRERQSGSKTPRGTKSG